MHFCRNHGRKFPREHFYVTSEGHYLCREARTRARQRYDATTGGKARYERYNRTERGAARLVRYNFTEQGRARFQRYSLTEAGQARLTKRSILASTAD